MQSHFIPYVFIQFLRAFSSLAALTTLSEKRSFCYRRSKVMVLYVYDSTNRLLIQMLFDNKTILILIKN